MEHLFEDPENYKVVVTGDVKISPIGQNNFCEAEIFNYTGKNCYKMKTKNNIRYSDPPEKMLIELLQNKIYDLEKSALKRVKNMKKRNSQLHTF